MARSAASRLLGLLAQIPPGAWMRVLYVCCQVEVCATSWSLVQRSAADCGVSFCVVYKPQEWGGPGPRWAVTPDRGRYVSYQRRILTEHRLKSILPLVCTLGRARGSMEGLSWNLIFRAQIKFGNPIPVLVKTEPHQRTLFSIVFQTVVRVPLRVRQSLVIGTRPG